MSHALENTGQTEKTREYFIEDVVPSNYASKSELNFNRQKFGRYRGEMGQVLDNVLWDMFAGEDIVLCDHCFSYLSGVE